jgi:hypothetical protein
MPRHFQSPTSFKLLRSVGMEDESIVSINELEKI